MLGAGILDPQLSGLFDQQRDSVGDDCSKTRVHTLRDHLQNYALGGGSIAPQNRELILTGISRHKDTPQTLSIVSRKSRLMFAASSRMAGTEHGTCMSMRAANCEGSY